MTYRALSNNTVQQSVRLLLRRNIQGWFVYLLHLNLQIVTMFCIDKSPPYHEQTGDRRGDHRVSSPYLPREATYIISNACGVLYSAVINGCMSPTTQPQATTEAIRTN